MHRLIAGRAAVVLLAALGMTPSANADLVSKRGYTIQTSTDAGVVPALGDPIAEPASTYGLGLALDADWFRQSHRTDESSPFGHETFEPLFEASDVNDADGLVLGENSPIVRLADEHAIGEIVLAFSVSSSDKRTTGDTTPVPGSTLLGLVGLIVVIARRRRCPSHIRIQPQTSD